jgi:uncharacterized protein
MAEGRILERSTQDKVVATTSEERTWAAIAHASTLLTLLVGLPTAGLSGLIFAFVPLLIYMSYRDKSQFVAFHAAQAFALQVIATVGLFVSILAGTIVLFVMGMVSVILLVILVGIILIMVTVLVGAVFVMAWISAPFVIGGFSIVAAIEAGNGRDYQYPYIGALVRNWLLENEQSPTPAV